MKVTISEDAVAVGGLVQSKMFTLNVDLESLY